MKYKHLFWGFLFLTLGILTLINNFSSLEFYMFDLWQYWPLFLIIIGVSLLIKQEFIRAILISATAIVLGFALFSTFKLGWGYFHNEVIVDFRNGINIKDIDEKKLQTNIFEEEFSSDIKYAVLRFEAGAGSFKIKDTTGYLFSAVTRGYDNNYKLKRDAEGENIKLSFNDEKDGLLIFRGTRKNRVNIKLNPNPVWKLNLDVGAAESEFDLRNYKVEDLDIDIGAASAKIVLGDLLDSVYVDIDAGASSIDILIPESAGCEVNTDIFLSSRKLEGFQKIEDDLYRTENFNSSGKKIFINIDTGVSSLKINRYSGESW
jgi:hypothetical protein